jgi:hypothetical protein
VPPARPTAKLPAVAPAAVSPARPPASKAPAPMSSAAALQSRIGAAGMRQMVLSQRAGSVSAPAPASPAPVASLGIPSLSTMIAGASERVNQALPGGAVSAGASTKPSLSPLPGRPPPRETAGAAMQTHGGAKPSAPGKDGAQPAAATPEISRGADESDSSEAGQLTALNARLLQTAGRQKKPADSRALVARTRQAAISPGPAGKTKAATETLESLEATGEATGTFDTAGFKKALQARLLQSMPDGKTGDDVEKALSHDSGAAVAGEMKQQLAGTQAKMVGSLAATAEQQQDPARHSPPAPPPLAAPQPGERPAIPSAAGAVPERLPDAALDTQADRGDADAQLASQNLTQGQLRRSNEPSFVDAAETRDTAERHSEAGPPEVRTAEEGAVGAARARGSALLAAGIGGLFGSRAAGFGRVFGQQDAAKAKEEAKRVEIAGRLDEIQRSTRTDVLSWLDMMEKVAVIRFELGLAAALRAFDEQRDKTEAAIRKVHRTDALSSGNVIGAAWAGWADLDEDEVEYTIRKARRAYNESIDRAIDAVADFVEPVLDRVKKRIDQGKKEAADYVVGLGTSVAEIAAAELNRINGEFDALSGEVDSRRDALIAKLGESYAASKKAVDERAQAFRDANKSWWQKLKEKVRAVIEAIIEIKNMLATKLAGVASAILDDPIGFLGKMVSAVKRGLNSFTDNFMNHLKTGFFEWLFGQAAGAGIVIPKKFDAAGIFELIAGVVGLTVANVRARAVAKVGAPVVAALEAAGGILLVLKEKGLAGLWDMLAEKLEALKESVLQQVQDMLLIEVVKAGIAWLIGLLNPAAAFIKACKAIYEIVMFFVNNGKRILDFVNAVLDAIGAIARGQLDAAAAKVEDSLARMIPLIIGFLAALLNLGNIADKVKKIIARLQAPVNKAIDWIIDKAVAGGKALVAAGKKAVKGVFDWARAKAGFKGDDGKSHTIYVDASAGQARLTIASTPTGASAFLDAYIERRSARSSKFESDHKTEISTARKAISAAQKQIEHIEKAEISGSSASALEKEQRKLLELNVAVSAALGALIGGDRAIGKSTEKYLLEGQTGTYASMPKPVGDKLTPDHQPQAAILEAAAEFSYFKKSGEMVRRAASRAARGFAINLHVSRHVEGRTFGSKGKKTKEEFVELVREDVKGLADPREQRKMAVGVIKKHLEEDRKKMDAVCENDAFFKDVSDDPQIEDAEKPKLIEGIKTRIKAGEKEMVAQDLESLID